MLFEFKLHEQKNDNAMQVDRVFTVKNLKEPIEYMSQDSYFETAWENLRLLITSILEGKSKHLLNIQTAYELGTNICQCGKAEKLYLRLKNELVAYFVDQTDFWKTMALSNDDFLGYLNTTWLEKKDQLKQISQILSELDRSYVIRNTPYRSIVDLGISFFNKYIVQQSMVKERLLTNLLLLMRYDRMGRRVDINLLNSITQMLQELGLYKNDFEPRLLTSMTNFYEQEARRLISKLSVSDYIKYTEHQFEFEESDHQVYLFLSTRHKLSKIVLDKWILDNLETLVTNGLYRMLDLSDTRSLQMLYYVSTSEKLSVICQSLVSYIKERGVTFFNKEHYSVNKSKNHDILLVKYILKFKNKLETLVNNIMNQDEIVLGSINDGFRQLIIDHEQNICRSLIEFMDAKLRSFELIDEENKKAKVIENTCHQMVSLFRFLQDKDVFENSYRISLSERLLSHCTYIEHEKIILKILASACGPEYTEKMESMIRDVDISKQLYYEEFTKNRNTPADSNIHILTLSKATWSFTVSIPTKEIQSSSIIMPSEIVSHLDSYRDFYVEKFKQKKLQWVSSLGTVILTGSFDSGPKTIVSNYTQAKTLLLFNDINKKSWTLEEIAFKLSIDKSEIEREVDVLCHERAPLLTKKLNTNYDDADYYEYNVNFICQQSIIILNKKSSKQFMEEDEVEQTKLDNEVTKRQLLENRKHQIAAATVRIMKKKLRLKHIELAAELRSVLPFSIEARELKTGIEYVINKQHIVREQAFIYKYVP